MERIDKALALIREERQRLQVHRLPAAVAPPPPVAAAAVSTAATTAKRRQRATYAVDQRPMRVLSTAQGGR